MRVGELRGWSQAVERARSLWPEIPMWAFDWAAQEKAAVRTYEEASAVTAASGVFPYEMMG